MKLCEALIHPDVRLNLVAREVLGYTAAKPYWLLTNLLLLKFYIWFQTSGPELNEDHLEILSGRLNKEEIYRLGQRLGIPSRQMDASFMKFCTSEKDASLSTWLKRQNNRQDAFENQGKAMVHPDVGLNLLAKEVLDYP